MSDLASSERPGLLGLTVGMLLGPVVALGNEELTYALDIWVCRSGPTIALHIADAACLAIALFAGALAYAAWRAMGHETEQGAGTAIARRRFMAISGIALSAISALLILAQWTAVFVFGPCARAS